MNASPAFLFVGQPSATIKEAYTLIKSYYCSHNVDFCTCPTCFLIDKSHHFSQIIIEPKKRYTLDDLNPVFEKISWALDHNEHRFFIIHKADLLSASCANSLLKIVEEPPLGYHFIFLAERLLSVLPTIRSRSAIKTIQSKTDTPTSNFLKHFTTVTPHPINFYKDLHENSPSEEETLLLLDEYITKATKHYQTLLEENNNTALILCSKRLELFKKSFHTPPMPGSAKIFWKNLYMHYFNLS